MERNLQKSSLSERLPEHIFTRIHEDIGQVSMCWDNPEKAGVFHSEEANVIAFNLCQFIADELIKKGVNKMSVENKETHISREFGMMDKAINELRGQVDEMESRISPIMQDVSFTEKKEETSQAEIVPLANSMRNLRYVIEMQSLRIEDFLRRLEL